MDQDGLIISVQTITIQRCILSDYLKIMDKTDLINNANSITQSNSA